MKNFVPEPLSEEVLQRMVEKIVETAHPEEIFLFGSRATGAAREDSDVDLLVILPDSAETGRTRRRMTGDIYRSLMPFRVSKDIIVCDRTEAHEHSESELHVVRDAMTSGRLLYARP